MRIGPIAQFWTRERARMRRLRKTSPSLSYRTRARGGYIIRMSPTAIGMFVVPDWKDPQNWVMPGKTTPQRMPRPMARNIQSGR